MRYLLSILALGLAVLCTRAAAAAEPQLHALVIGINEYKGLKEREQLKGGVNDARLIRDALQGAGAASVVTLLNREATLDAVRSNLRQLAARARSGDWILVHFAGHGIQLPALDPSSEQEARQKMDEVLVTTEFDRSGQRGELRDDEIHRWLKSIKSDVNVMFIADACHSGTLHRCVGCFDSRFVPSVRGLDRGVESGGGKPTLRSAPPIITKVQDVQLPNVVMVAATVDEKKVAEIFVEGQVHGALSVAVARALKGNADAAGNRDGSTTLVEFDRFLKSETARLSAEGVEKQQTSTAKFTPGREAEVIPFLGAPGKARPASSPTQVIRLFIKDGGTRLDRTYPGISLVKSRSDADVVWSVSKGQVELAKGNSQLLAEGVRADVKDAGLLPETLLGAVGKLRALTNLSELVSRQPVKVEVCQDVCQTWTADVPLRDGSKATLQVDQVKGARHLFAFNLASTGVLQIQDELRSNGIPLVVSSPFGRDDLVVVASSEPLEALKQRMARLACGNLVQGQVCNSSQPVAERTIAELAAFVSTEGKRANIRVGHAIVYTRGE